MQDKIDLQALKNPYLSKVKRVFLSVLILVMSMLTLVTIGAQSIIQPKQIDQISVGVLYAKERLFEVRAQSNGAAMSVQFGKIVTYYKTHFYQFDLGLLKHPKEYRQSITFNTGNPFTQSSNSFTYGKQNHFLVLRGGVGKKVYYSDKAKRKGVALGVSYEFGPSIGFLKPYYLKLSRLEPNGFVDYVSTERYTEENEDIFLDNSKIVGPGSFFKGFGELKALPGIHARIAAHFSLGAFEKNAKAFEVGIMIDAYFKRVPIMIIENNSPAFINGFISFQIGKRE